MRLRITLNNPQYSAVPLNYQHHLSALVYSLLADSNAEYAGWLHSRGYSLDDGPKAFKFFVYSWLRGQNRIEGDDLVFSPGTISWLISSPMREFLEHFATGLLARGSIRVGGSDFQVTAIDAFEDPEFGEQTRLTCLSPIVCSVKQPDGSARYLVPVDGTAFSSAVRANLMHKHKVLMGTPPEDDSLELTFDASYLQRAGGGTKLISFKNIQIRGAFAPFVATGSPDLLRIGYATGFGEKNASGFGMVEVK